MLFWNDPSLAFGPWGGCGHTHYATSTIMHHRNVIRMSMLRNANALVNVINDVALGSTTVSAEHVIQIISLECLECSMLPILISAFISFMLSVYCAGA